MVQNVRYSNGLPSHVTLPFEYRTPKLCGNQMNLGIQMVTVELLMGKMKKTKQSLILVNLTLELLTMYSTTYCKNLWIFSTYLSSGTCGLSFCLSCCWSYLTLRALKVWTQLILSNVVPKFSTTCEHNDLISS